MDEREYIRIVWDYKTEPKPYENEELTREGYELYETGIDEYGLRFDVWRKKGA